MSASSLLFLQVRKKPARELLGDVDVLLHRADLLLLAWAMDFLDLSADEASAENLLSSFGVELLALHRDTRGVLVAPSALGGDAAADYESGITAYGLGGLWLPNVARQHGVRLVAAEEAEIPLPRFPGSKLVEFYVVKTARAVRELELSVEPLRTVRVELRARATPREVSAFYLPLLKAQGLKVKRRIWSSGSAERLLGSSGSVLGFVHAEQRGPQETCIEVSWVQLA